MFVFRMVNRRIRDGQDLLQMFCRFVSCIHICARNIIKLKMSSVFDGMTNFSFKEVCRQSTDIK